MTGGDLLHRIVSEIERLDERDASELPPLYDSVDADALQAVVKFGIERIEFQHAGYRVVITHGEVFVHDIENECDNSTNERALAALNETDDETTQEYLEALRTVIDYRTDSTFEDPLNS